MYNTAGYSYLNNKNFFTKNVSTAGKREKIMLHNNERVESVKEGDRI